MLECLVSDIWSLFG